MYLKMNKYCNWCLFLMAFFVHSCSKKTIGYTQVCSAPSFPTHPKAASFQSLIQKYVDQGLPGIVLLVRDSNGVWAGSAGMADITQKIPMQTCHIAKVASLTKLFMATLAFQLSETGQLNLDQKINT